MENELLSLSLNISLHPTKHYNDAVNSFIIDIILGASLVVQWLRIYLVMKGTLV